MRKKTRWVPIATAMTFALALTACSSSKKSPSASGSSGTASVSSTGSSASGSIKVGVITDTTGAASSGYTSTEKGIKAYVDGVNAAGGVSGHKISYVMADSTSTPSGALTAAQKLVQSDKVFAVISVTSFMFGAEAYLLKQGVPVLGTGFDGPEWIDTKNTNMFGAIGIYNPGSTYTSEGQAVKKIGGTACGSIGYIESPSATQAAAAFGKSCAAAGLKNAYTTNVSFGSTDIAPVALAMKGKGVDSTFLATVPSTGFALSAALRTVGVKLTAMVLPQGYGNDLLQSAPAVQAAQGFYFLTQLQPIEMNTPATKLLAKRMAAAGESNDPGFAESAAYLAMTAFGRGVQAAGDSPTKQSFIDGLRKVNDFDGEGLLAPNKIDFSNYNPAKQCVWYVTLKGNKFILVDGLAPICGTKIS
jgi:branched-chain amino acid transport system substrate-binding protein